MKMDKRVVYFVTTLVVLVAAALVSILCMPVYYVMLSDAMPPSMAVKLKRTKWLPDDGMYLAALSGVYAQPCVNYISILSSHT